MLSSGPIPVDAVQQLLHKLEARGEGEGGGGGGGGGGGRRDHES